jgi:hypothetical protein
MSADQQTMKCSHTMPCSPANQMAGCVACSGTLSCCNVPATAGSYSIFERTPRVSMDEQRDQNDYGNGYAEHQK